MDNNQKRPMHGREEQNKENMGQNKPGQDQNRPGQGGFGQNRPNQGGHGQSQKPTQK
jgi:hypothetical protein